MYLGIDIGSSYSKAMILDKSGKVISKAVVDAGAGSLGPDRVVEQTFEVAGVSWEHIRRCVCTGYGRMLYEHADKQVSEISCHGKGAIMSVDGISTVIDIGGQDIKIICISNKTKCVQDFVMNDKCAAGTGRFLELVARVFGCKIEEISQIAQKGRDGLTISSVCSVFAESEIISQLAMGKQREDVMLAAHKAVARKITGLAGRVDIKPHIVITGGAALNTTLCEEIGKNFGVEIVRLREPQLIGALGAAGYAMEMDGLAAILTE